MVLLVDLSVISGLPLLYPVSLFECDSELFEFSLLFRQVKVNLLQLILPKLFLNMLIILVRNSVA